MAACEAVVAHPDRFFGSQVCGVEAAFVNPWSYQNEVYLCDKHHAEYFDSFLEREYTYYKMINADEGATGDE